MHNLLHSDAWDLLKGTKPVENLKKEIMNLAVQNRQDVIIPECRFAEINGHNLSTFLDEMPKVMELPGFTISKVVDVRKAPFV